jgi:hypothetical protein
MPTFIDESGDTGHARDSLPYFRVAAVWMPTLEAAASFREAVRELRRRLGLAEAFEFKFARTHSHPDRRRSFFRLALEHDFRFAVCAIDKTAGHWRNAPSQEQHWASATCLAVYLRDVYHKAEKPERPLHDPILVDDNADRRYLGAIRTAFRGLRSRLHPDVPMVRKPRFRASGPDEMMQLVDMVCGVVGDSIDGNPTWYDLIRERCLGVIRLP